MGSNNQLNYLKRLLPTLSGPVLEIGSKDYGNTSSFRDFYVTNEYIGVDLEPGKGVDKVGDLTKDCAGLPEDYFALGICCSVLDTRASPGSWPRTLPGSSKLGAGFTLPYRGYGATTLIPMIISAFDTRGSNLCFRLSTGTTNIMRPPLMVNTWRSMTIQTGPTTRWQFTPLWEQGLESICLIWRSICWESKRRPAQIIRCDRWGKRSSPVISAGYIAHEERRYKR